MSEHFLFPALEKLVLYLELDFLILLELHF